MNPTMNVIITAAGEPVRYLAGVADFTEFGDTADHFTVVAPAYLAALDCRDEITVTYQSERFGTIIEHHTVAARDDAGNAVGTNVRYAS